MATTEKPIGQVAVPSPVNGMPREMKPVATFTRGYGRFAREYQVIEGPGLPVPAVGAAPAGFDTLAQALFAGEWPAHRAGCMQFESPLCQGCRDAVTSMSGDPRPIQRPCKCGGLVHVQEQPRRSSEPLAYEYRCDTCGSTAPPKMEGP